MNTHAHLRHLAISAAKNADWQAAVNYNTDLLTQKPDDAGAWNRLGIAHLQLKQSKEAQTAFKKALEIDRNNPIAQKHLQKLKSNQAINAPSFAFRPFIEEPGKTKTVELHRLAGKQALDTLSVGQDCELIIKKRYISVEANGQYIGALPEDLSFRLAKLIERGNVYSCTIRSCNSKSCMVFLRETSRSIQNSEIHSFPLTKSSLSSHSDLDDRFLLDEDIPVEMGSDEDESAPNQPQEVDRDSLD
jgi:tetratricopeptide (TPR) repeat protein